MTELQAYYFLEITIKNVLGNTVYNEVVENNHSGFEKEINFSNNLESGVYFVIFTTPTYETIQKVIIE